MLFILKVIRVIPLFFDGSVVDIMTPYGTKSLVMEAGEEAVIRVPDFHTILTFTHKSRRVSYSIVRLIEGSRINFAPMPFRADISMSRVVEETDKHFVPIGHRGSGSNAYRKKMGKPFIPENTMQSYQHAYKLGAKWVDMDLTITSDGIVVIYHDFTVNKTPVWNLTFNQFMSKVDYPTVFETVVNDLDPRINFAVEIKYPSVDEIKSENLGSTPNLKKFVQKVIDIVRKGSDQRQVNFNSFEPDALVYIKKIAPEFDIFLDTEGVPNKFTDPRRNSLEEAIQFCLDNDLQGIVTDTETISSAPLQQTMTVHSLGLRLMLYFYRSFFKKTDYVEEITKFDCVGIDALVVENIPQALKIIKNITTCTYDDNY